MIRILFHKGFQQSERAKYERGLHFISLQLFKILFQQQQQQQQQQHYAATKKIQARKKKQT